MKYNFDEVVNRRNTNCMKWDGGELLKQMGITNRFDEETISVFTADMDFKCPPEVIKAVKEVAEFGVYGYPYRFREHWMEFRKPSVCLQKQVMELLSLLRFMVSSRW